MSFLAALVRAYEQLGETAPPHGYANERISFEIVLRSDGSPAGPPIDRRVATDKKIRSSLMLVPQSIKRTSGIASNFLWDKSSYALGISAITEKRSDIEHAAFVKLHRSALKDTLDEGLQAFHNFVCRWHVEDFFLFGWPLEMVDQNVVFSWLGDREKQICIHDRTEAQAIWRRLSLERAGKRAVCLVTGKREPFARLHPSIKGVQGAQPSGASLVSFNLDASCSYGHEQGDNAPISEFATYAYAYSLNKLLETDSRRQIQIGGLAILYWAEAKNAAVRAKSESLFNTLVTEHEWTSDSDDLLKEIDAINYQSSELIKPEGRFKFCIFVLSPNSSRLSVRFFLEDNFETIFLRYCRHIREMQVGPTLKEVVSIKRLLVEIAAHKDASNIPTKLAGEWLQSIFLDERYPLTLLTTIIRRIRAEKEINTTRIGIIKSILIRNFGIDLGVELKLDIFDLGYIFGRLFAVYEYAQIASSDGRAKNTIFDSYFAAASSAPAKIFPLLHQKALHRLDKLRSVRPSTAVFLQSKIAYLSNMSINTYALPLDIKNQALFIIGYFYQKDEFF